MRRGTVMTLWGLGALGLIGLASWLLVTTVVSPWPGFFALPTPSPTATEEPVVPADPQPSPQKPTPTPTPTPTEEAEEDGESEDADEDGGGSPNPTPDPGHAPVAVGDIVLWDLGVDATTATGDVLANDTDADGDTLSVVPASGTFMLDGDTIIAGTYLVAADGILTLTADADEFGPLPSLGDGETATVTLSYTVTDGTHSDVGDVTVVVTGRLDPYYAVGPIAGVTAGTVLDLSDSTPTPFDASATFASPDGGTVPIVWSATSTGTVPAAFTSGTPSPTVSALNAEWGSGAVVTVTATATPTDGRPPVSQSVTFSVG